MNAATRLEQYSRKQLRRFRQNFTKAASGDIDAVHDLRVASRRLHEPLLVLATFLGHKPVQRLRRELRQTRRAFREVRDLDVLQAGLRAGTPTADPEAAAELDALLSRRRARSLRRALAKSESLHPERGARDAARLLSRFREQHRDADEQLDGRVLEMLQERTETLRGRAPVPGPASDLHALRIALKRVRYCSELLLHIRCSEDEEHARSMAAMQELLGAWNDHVNATRRLARLSTRRRVVADRSSWVASILGLAREHADQADCLRRDIITRWASFEHTLESFLERASGASTSPGCAALPTGPKQKAAPTRPQREARGHSARSSESV